ncbi:MAG: N-acetylneuraminate synthase family protein [Coriobacteriia bacterium]|nr:N-acetylneuraminate synthase family protein [Coriobacteriia bacterium]
MGNTIKLGGSTVGLGHPTYFIADIAANHDGDIERAKELIYLAAEAGASCAKFQNFQAAKIVSGDGFRSLGTQSSHQEKWKKSVFEVYDDASLSLSWTQALAEECAKAGIDYATSPYDFESVDAVEPFTAFFKIGSGDITWTEMCEYMAQKNLPVVLATGASTMGEVSFAVSRILEHIPANQFALLQCNTNYTGSLENMKYINLSVLQTYAQKYPELVLGLSDHTPGHATVLGAIALGARIIEKHFTDDIGRVGPDHAFSMCPKAWREMVDRGQELEHALGDGIKRVGGNENETVILQRRSLHAARGIAAGERLTADDLEPLRPAPNSTFKPDAASRLIGAVLVRECAKGMPLTVEHFERMPEGAEEFIIEV